MSLLIRYCGKNALGSSALQRMTRHFQSSSFRTRPAYPFSNMHGAMFSTDEKSEQSDPKKQSNAIQTSQCVTDSVLTDTNVTDRVTDRVTDTYIYTAGGMALAGLSAMACFDIGITEHVLSYDKWVGMGFLAAPAIPFVGMLYTDYANMPKLKRAMYLTFLVASGASMSVFGFAGSSVSHAMLYTGCVVGGLSTVALNLPAGKFDMYRGGLYTGLGIIAATATYNMFWPMPLLHHIHQYGGLCVFSGLVLLNTQDMVKKARHSINYDSTKASLNIYMSTAVLFSLFM